jgi:hypothetical protein
MTIFTQDYEADIVVPLPFFKDLFETQSKVVDNLNPRFESNRS